MEISAEQKQTQLAYKLLFFFVICAKFYVSSVAIELVNRQFCLVFVVNHIHIVPTNSDFREENKCK